MNLYKYSIKNEEVLRAFHEVETRNTYSDNWQNFRKPEKYPCVICYCFEVLANAEKREFRYMYVYDHELKELS